MGGGVKQIFLSSNKVLFSELYAFFELTKSDFMAFENKNFRKKYANKLSENASFIVCRNDSGDLIGMIAAYMNRAPLSYITHVSVRSDYRRHGLFEAMYMFLEQEALLSGFREIKLEVRNHNVPAVRAYEKVGFRMLDAATENTSYMVKQLACDRFRREDITYN